MPPSLPSGATGSFDEAEVFCVSCKRNHTVTPLPDVPLHDYTCPHRRTPLFYGERFKPLRLLGKGSHTSILLARDLGPLAEDDEPSRDGLCVMKVYTSKASDTQSMFESEVAAMQLIRHPNIPSYIAHGTHTDGAHYIAMEYIEGEDLSRLLARTTAGFNEDTVRKLLIDILPVLSYLHQKGFVHRDIKPENIVHRNLDGRYVLVDVGHARGGPSTSPSLNPTGYTAPEQAAGKAVPASDLYSLGATCISLLTKQAPTRQFLSQWGPREGVSGPLAAYLKRLVREAPELRYPNGGSALAGFPFCDEDRMRLSSNPPPHSQRRVRRSQTPSPPRFRTGAAGRTGRQSTGPQRRPVGGPENPSVVVVPAEKPSSPSGPFDFLGRVGNFFCCLLGKQTDDLKRRPASAKAEQGRGLFPSATTY